MATGLSTAPKTTTHKVLGQLPAGWKAVTLRQCCIGQAEYGLNAPAEPFQAEAHRYLRITDIDEDGNLIDAEKVSTSHRDAENYSLSEGEIVFARTGASVGKSYVYRSADGPLVFAGYLVRFHPNPEILDVGFLNAFVRTRAYWKWVKQMSSRSGQPGINGREFGSLPVPLPPLREQRRIARILSTWDKAISLLQEQITAKELRLRGLIDQLVSGQRHGATNGQLPKGWRWVRLGEVGSFKKGKGISKSDLRETGVPCITYGELYTLHHIRVKRFHSHIAPETAKASERIHNGDILFAGSGETAVEIGKAAAFLGEEEAYAGGDVIILRPKKIDPLYLSTALSSEIADRQRLKFGQGNSVVHLYPSQLAEFKVPMPPAALQEQIAGVVRAVDEEVDILRTRLEQLQLQKKGLMQGLLSGRYLNAN